MATNNFADQLGGNTGVTGGAYNGTPIIAMPSTGQGFNERVPTSSDTNAAGAASDPFGYTMGSLLTPWTQQFQYTPTAGAGQSSGPSGPSTPAPTFGFDPLSYSFRDPGSYNAPAAYQGSSFAGARTAAPTPFTGTSPYAADRYSVGGGYNPATFMSPTGGPDPNAVSPLSVARYTPQGQFDPSTVAIDPGFAFRTQQGEQALQQSAAAKGTLRGGGTLKALTDYGQNAASQEYAAAYNRAYGQWTGQNTLDQAAYDRNSAAGVAENQTAYQRAQQGQQDQFANALQAYQANQQAQQFGYGTNLQNQQFAANFNQQAGATENQTAWDRAAQTYGINTTAQQQAEQENYTRNFQEWQANQQASQSAYGLNAQTGLNAYQANSATAAAMGNLGWNVASGTFDRNLGLAQYNFGNAMNAYNAANAPSGSGGISEATDYARQLQQYQMQYNQFENNQDTQYARLMGMASLGLNATGASNAAAGQYGANAASGLYGAANANAAATVGGANANASAIAQIAQMAQISALLGRQGAAGGGGGSGMGPM